jgi:hypothetical protein
VEDKQSLQYFRQFILKERAMVRTPLKRNKCDEIALACAWAKQSANGEFFVINEIVLIPAND